MGPSSNLQARKWRWEFGGTWWSMVAGGQLGDCDVGAYLLAFVSSRKSSKTTPFNVDSWNDK